MKPSKTSFSRRCCCSISTKRRVLAQAQLSNQQWLDGIAIEQIELAAAKTFDPETRLYYHAWNGAEDGVWLGLTPPSRAAPLPGTVVSPFLWARSLGWFLVGIVDVLEHLPDDHPSRGSLREIVSNIAHGRTAAGRQVPDARLQIPLRARQRPAGFGAVLLASTELEY